MPFEKGAEEEEIASGGSGGGGQKRCTPAERRDARHEMRDNGEATEVVGRKEGRKGVRREGKKGNDQKKKGVKSLLRGFSGHASFLTVICLLAPEFISSSHNHGRDTISDELTHQDKLTLPPGNPSFTPLSLPPSLPPPLSLLRYLS